MTPKIFVPRSVKEKLPEKNGVYICECEYHSESAEGGIIVYHEEIFVHGAFLLKFGNDYEVTHWLEEMSLEEYLKELGLKTYVFQEMPARKKSRCCGRCDGVNDVCVADTKCDPHGIYGCEVCFGER